MPIRTSWILLGLLALLPAAALAQNVIVDSGFENGFVPGCGQGAFIDTWAKAQGNPSIFSEDCALAPGLPLTFLNQFTQLGSAANGLRFASVQPGGVPQALAAPVSLSTPAVGVVTLSVALADASGPGCLELYSNASLSLSGASYLGCIQVSSHQWQSASLNVSAFRPDDFQYLILAANQAHVAVDDVELQMSEVSIPSMQTWSMLMLAGLLMLVGLRRVSMPAGVSHWIRPH